jgi:hypothetical protein
MVVFEPVAEIADTGGQLSDIEIMVDSEINGQSDGIFCSRSTSAIPKSDPMDDCLAPIWLDTFNLSRLTEAERKCHACDRTERRCAPHD